MTERLYYTDSFRFDFEASVVEVISDPRPALVLDATAFYPTSGGQVFDTGSLAIEGKELRVVEVTEDESGRVLHILAGPAPVAQDARVRGRIDEPRRRDHMQQHSGQHVLSAAFLRLFDMPTVSFHMGDQFCTIDLDTKSVSPEQLSGAEDLANRIVQEDRPVRVRFVSLEEARGLGLRKLPPDLKRELRLIDVLDFDLTACGGTHVRTTGQIGPILLRKTEKVRQGVRVEFVCGERALRAARRDHQVLAEAAAILSAHPWEVPRQLQLSIDEARQQRKRGEQWMEEAAAMHAAELLSEADAATPRIVAKMLSERELTYAKLVAQKIARSEGPAVALLACSLPAPALVFAQTPGAGFDMQALLKEIVGAYGGRGGGTRDLAQGGVPSVQGLQEALHALATRLRSQIVPAAS